MRSGFRDRRRDAPAAAHHRDRVAAARRANLQFARALRSAVEHDIQVVALTRAGAELFDQARREGFDLAFSKPLDIDDMERHVRRTTRIHKLEL